MRRRNGMNRILAFIMRLAILTAVCLAPEVSFCQAAVNDSPFSVNFRIPASAIVPGPKMFLSDLGTMEGTVDPALVHEIERVNLGAAPLPGHERRLTKDYLEFILKQHRLNSKISLKMDSSVLIRTEATCITGAEIKNLLEKQLPEKNPDYISRTLELVNLPAEIWFEKGDYQLQAAPLGKIPELGTAVFRVAIIANGEKKKTLNVCGKIRVTAKVYQASRSMRLKEAVTEADFVGKTQELTSGREIFGKFPAECRMIRTVNTGEILEKQDVQTIPAVMKDNEVGVSVKVDGVEITVKAVAKSDGWMGDEIQLYNPASKKIFKGRVIGRNLAEVRTE